LVTLRKPIEVINRIITFSWATLVVNTAW